LTELGTHPEMTCEVAHKIARNQLQTIRGKIKKLRLLEKELKRIAMEHDSGQVGDCFVLQALAEHKNCGQED